MFRILSNRLRIKTEWSNRRGLALWATDPLLFLNTLTTHRRALTIAPICFFRWLSFSFAATLLSQPLQVVRQSILQNGRMLFPVYRPSPCFAPSLLLKKYSKLDFFNKSRTRGRVLHTKSRSNAEGPPCWAALLRLSGIRDSNSRLSAWEANTLPLS